MLHTAAVLALTFAAGCSADLARGDEEATPGSAAWAVAQALPFAEDWQSDARVAVVEANDVSLGISTSGWAVTFVSESSQTAGKFVVPSPDYDYEIAPLGALDGQPLTGGWAAADLELVGWRVDSTDVPALDSVAGFYVALAMPAWLTASWEAMPDVHPEPALYFVIQDCPRADLYSAGTGDSVAVILDYLSTAGDSSCDW